MNNSILIVISKKIYDSSHAKIKAFIASFLIHITLFATLIHFKNSSELTPLPLESKSIVVSLASYTPSMPAIKEPAKPTPQPVHKVKKTKKVVKPEKKVVKEVPKEKTPEKVQPEPVVPSEAFTPPTTDVEPVAQQEVAHQETPDAHSPLADSNLPQLHTRSTEVSNEELARIRILIQNSLRYPAIARKLKIEGVVLISFSLSKDGHVDSLSLLKSSGSSALDKRALQTVSLLDGEYPPLSKKVDLRIPISFSLQQS